MNICKKYYILLIGAILFLETAAVQGVYDLSVAPDITATTGVVIDVENGQVIWEKDMHQKRPPASTTKILTAVVALEEGNLDEVVAVSRKATLQEGSSIYLKPGEKITLRDLLYGLLLASGNDSAVAIAEHIAGSVKKFSVLMNRKAREIGAHNSQFMNPSGLPEEGHFSTAYDLALIMRYALQNEVFSEITATRKKIISGPDNKWGRRLKNHNKLLWTYKKTTGGKTGYTKTAGRCLIASAKQKNLEVVSVVLDCPSDWEDTKKLFTYSFTNFMRQKVVSRGEKVFELNWKNSQEKKLQLISGQDGHIVKPVSRQIKIKKRIYINPDLKLPLKKGTEVGKIQINFQGQPVKEIPLYAGNSIHHDSPFIRFWHNMSDYFKNVD
ncbi:MAG: D-alanyl-D-alanine carboxypeptidase family protein [Bacillota bacterium]